MNFSKRSIKEDTLSNTSIKFGVGGLVGVGSGAMGRDTGKWVVEAGATSLIVSKQRIVSMNVATSVGTEFINTDECSGLNRARKR